MFLRLIRDIMFHQPESSGGGIASALEYLYKAQKKKAIVFLISDFIDEGFDRQLTATAKKHDLIAVRLEDPRERVLPNVGRMALSDAETGEIVVVNTSNKKVRTEYEEKQKQRSESLDKVFRASGVDQIRIECDKPYFEPMVRFFKERERRRRFG